MRFEQEGGNLSRRKIASVGDRCERWHVGTCLLLLGVDDVTGGAPAPGKITAMSGVGSERGCCVERNTRSHARHHSQKRPEIPTHSIFSSEADALIGCDLIFGSSNAARWALSH
jgi:hypothetical protein